MEKKPNRTWALVGTIAAILLCGCPGLAACIFGVLIAVGVPFTTSFNGGPSTTQPLSIYYGIGLLCLSIIFVAIAIVVPVLLLRKKKDAAAAAVLPPQEPLPPAA
jgi:hypothetical protein